MQLYFKGLYNESAELCKDFKTRYDATLLLAKIYEKQNKIEEEIELLEYYIQVQPYNKYSVKHLYLLAGVYAKKGNLDKAK